MATNSTVAISEPCDIVQRRKSVRFSRFEKVYPTHSSIEYDLDLAQRHFDSI
ncbi:9059_t:CDS:2 [Acaulospora colombiana]|uniref:9059_t:CDS:1 n=1 Tax=Acaulospora colombiana TaxID=27376 RepID=A0ACA9JWW3_9GLOM|nr:9059_t:CDS:2 [Acaulospora colombiana]